MFYNTQISTKKSQFAIRTDVHQQKKKKNNNNNILISIPPSLPKIYECFWDIHKPVYEISHVSQF